MQKLSKGGEGLKATIRSNLNRWSKERKTKITKHGEKKQTSASSLLFWLSRNGLSSWSKAVYGNHTDGVVAWRAVLRKKNHKSK